MTVEISMYPLTEAYEPAIGAFIEKLRTEPRLAIETNSTSTRLSGESEVLIPLLHRACAEAWEERQTVFSMKWLRGDLLS
ncbi:hypothetical protein GC167_02695 [bacterium]|nr:hypothetical protein [bacterium]